MAGAVDVELSLTQRRFTRAKLIDPVTGTTHDVALDGQLSTVVPEALIAAEGQAVIARRGRLRPELDQMRKATTGKVVPVWIWTDFRQQHHRREDLLANAALAATEATARRNALQGLAGPIVAWLDARGYKVRERGELSPLIVADVPDTALSALEQLPGVATIGLQEPGRPSTTTWFEATRLDTVQQTLPTTSRPFCVKEGSQPDTYGVLDVPSSNIASPTGYTDWHTRYTTELIAGTEGRRAAPGAPTFIANWANFSGASIDAWCFDRTRAMNFSWTFSDGSPGGLNGNDYALDFYATVSPYPTIAVAAGNKGNVAGYDSVQNRGANVLIVGASDDKNTAATSDDTMAAFSSWRNAPTSHGDREAPAIVAPGVNVTSSSGAVGSGTSASSPIALGAGLLAFEQDSTYLSWPEMARASFIAAAGRQVDGVVSKLSAGGTDLKQGAGQLDAFALMLLSAEAKLLPPGSASSPSGHFAKTYTFASDFEANGLSYDTYQIQVVQGMKMRVALAWDATVTGCQYANESGCSSETLDADLDLQVFRPDGTLACASTTYDSSWEFCDVTYGGPYVSATYTARIRKVSTTANSTYVGVAWIAH